MQTNQSQVLIGVRQGLMRTLNSTIRALEDNDRELSKAWGGADAVATTRRTRSTKPKTASQRVQQPTATAAAQGPAATVATFKNRNRSGSRRTDKRAA